MTICLDYRCSASPQNDRQVPAPRCVQLQREQGSSGTCPGAKEKKNHVQVRDFALKGCTATVYVCGAVLKRLKAQLRFWKQLFLELW